MLPYNYKLTAHPEGVMLSLNGRKYGYVDELELTDKYVTFKNNGVIVRQHFRRKI